jgi:hypothetical protein
MDSQAVLATLPSLLKGKNVTQYRLQMFTLKWLADIPGTQNQEGYIDVIGDAGEPNITSLIPVGTKFYLSPTVSSGGEAQTITRTCTSVFFDSQTNTNTFTFTPAPLTSWTSNASVTVVQKSDPIPFTGYVALSDAATPDASLIDACITVCQQAEGANGA